ncbi:MAG: hypothetical protein M1828_002816 [Chrysothrix sp. TS-e1954]|nr:MAG: hypothetical protein M1828_002816 [Chrysothrix sp. TS-e1954]
MASYLSNVLTNTTSRYNQLRRTLLSDESDGDTEDDSHISRVLRAYYVEKGRPFPPWLPPDPKSRSSQRHQQQQYQQSGDNYGQNQAPPRRAGGLNDLWDTPKDAQPSSQPQSLRRGAPAPGRSERFGSEGTLSSRLQPAGGRPQPTSRDGSYQSLRSQRTSNEAPQQTPSPLMPGGQTGATGGGGGSGSTQDRLKARLWGGQRPSSPGQPYGR